MTYQRRLIIISGLLLGGLVLLAHAGNSDVTPRRREPAPVVAKADVGSRELLHHCLLEADRAGRNYADCAGGIVAACVQTRQAAPLVCQQREAAVWSSLLEDDTAIMRRRLPTDLYLRLRRAELAWLAYVNGSCARQPALPVARHQQSSIEMRCRHAEFARHLHGRRVQVQWLVAQLSGHARPAALQAALHTGALGGPSGRPIDSTSFERVRAAGPAGRAP